MVVVCRLIARAEHGVQHTVQAVDRIGRTYATRTVRLKAGVRTDLGALVPRKASLTLTGRAPAGALVTVNEGVLYKQARATADGTYRIDGLVPGRYGIQAQLQGHAASSLTRTLTATSG